jgi:hypothetical protein
MEDNELFGERHEQEENGLYGKKHAELCDWDYQAITTSKGVYYCPKQVKSSGDFRDDDNRETQQEYYGK